MVPFLTSTCRGFFVPKNHVNDSPNGAINPPIGSNHSTHRANNPAGASKHSGSHATNPVYGAEHSGSHVEHSRPRTTNSASDAMAVAPAAMTVKSHAKHPCACAMNSPDKKSQKQLPNNPRRSDSREYATTSTHHRSQT